MERASDFIARIARMNKLGDRIEGEPYQPDGCADEDAQALYRLIAEAREMVKGGDPALPIKTVIASLEGIRLDIYRTHVHRFLYDSSASDWRYQDTLEIQKHGAADWMITEGINDYDKLAVLHAIAEARNAR